MLLTSFSYDWSHKMGRADEVKAYIGYYGHQSESDPNVQFRRVKRIVTTEGWVKTKGQKCFDGKSNVIFGVLLDTLTSF